MYNEPGRIERATEWAGNATSGVRDRVVDTVGGIGSRVQETVGGVAGRTREVAAEAITRMELGRVDGATVANVGTIRGGESAEVIPDVVHLEGMVRSRTNERLDRQVEAMTAAIDGAVARWTARKPPAHRAEQGQDRARTEGRRGSSAQVATDRRLMGPFVLVGEELPALCLGGEVERSAIYSLSEPLQSFLRALAATALLTEPEGSEQREMVPKRPTLRSWFVF
jgi:hypothetical protein